MKGAVVKAKGEKCETNKKGVCSISFAKMGKDKFNAVAKAKDYARREPAPQGVLRTLAQRTRTTDLPRVRRSSMSWRACPKPSRSYVAPTGGSIAPEIIRGMQVGPLLLHVARPGHGVGAPADPAHVDVVQQQPVDLDLRDALTGGEADDHQPPLGREHAQRVGERRPADHVDHDVHTASVGQAR